MNVLPLVFSFLALITILTYTRLSGFVVSKAVHHEYQQFVKNYQEDAYEAAAVEQYNSNQRKTGTKKQSPERVKADRQLNLYPLLKNDGERGKEAAWIFQRLIETLYGEARFFQEMVSGNPRLIEELIAAMQLAFENRQDKSTFQKKDLCTLELNSPDLQLFFYKILKERPKVEDEEDEEELLARSASRILNEVILIKKEVLPLRMYLANPVLLKAIFKDEKLVENIVTTRKGYYNMIRKNPDRKEALSEEFRSHFASSLPPAVQLNSVNWDLSGTSPDQKISKDI